MNKQVNNNNQELNGLFIYHDPSKGCVFYDIFKKNGYVISRSEYQSYSKFSLLKLLSIFSIYLFVELLDIELWLATLIGIGLFIAIEIIFRKTFIYKLPVIDKYKPIKKDRLYEAFAKNMSMIRLIIATVIALITSILVIIYAKTENYGGFNEIITYIIALIMFAMFVNGVIAISIKRKNQQK